MYVYVRHAFILIRVHYNRRPVQGIRFVTVKYTVVTLNEISRGYIEYKAVFPSLRPWMGRVAGRVDEIFSFLPITENLFSQCTKQIENRVQKQLSLQFIQIRFLLILVTITSVTRNRIFTYASITEEKLNCLYTNSSCRRC